MKKLVGIFSFTLIFVGCLPLVSSAVGYDFLPSVWWVSRGNWIATSAGLIGAAFFLALVITGISKIQYSRFRKMLAVLCSPFFGYFLAKSSTLIAFPLIFAVFAGNIELPFRVHRSDSLGGRNCRSPVDLMELPFPFATICNVSNQLRGQVGPGSRIMISGKGTRYGLFVASIRKAD